jgi:hypothetical protein
MNSKMRRNFSGSFTALDCRGGAWQLTRSAPHRIDVFLRDAQTSSSRSFAGTLEDLGIEWQGEKALLTFMCNGRVGAVEAANAIVHEPLARLYQDLPLARIDAKARRFWRRVFALARIPGGRYLLMLLARSGRR